MPARYAVARILTTTMGELHTPKCGVGIHAQIADVLSVLPTIPLGMTYGTKSSKLEYAARKKSLIL